jgi:flagellar motor switch protein FliN/FliY
MSEKHTSGNREAAVLVKAFPQLENPAPGVAVKERSEAGSNLKAVPMSPPEPASNVAQFPAPAGRTRRDIDFLGDIFLTVSFEVGRQYITVQQLMEMTRGSILPLQHVFVDSIDVLVDEHVIARGEAINMKNRYGVRISELVMPAGMEPK